MSESHITKPSSTTPRSSGSASCSLLDLSDTPEADKAAMVMETYHWRRGVNADNLHDVVKMEFAEKLERERNAKIQEVRELRATVVTLKVAARRYVDAARLHNQSPFDLRIAENYARAKACLEAEILENAGVTNSPE